MNCAIVFSVDNLYVEPFQVFFNSLEATSSIPNETPVFILHTESLNQNSKRVLEAFLRKYGRDVTFLDASHLIPTNLPIRPRDHVSPATFFRLFIAEILPLEIDQAIYLDSDMLALRSIAQLFEEPVKGLLGAVDHCTPGNALRLWGSLGGSYFQAGVLVIPVHKWRQYHLAGEFIEVMATQQSNIKWWDQDILNIALRDRWQRLAIWYNVTDPLFRILTLKEITDNAILIHYNGSNKPWNTVNSSPFAEHWLRQYAATFGQPFDKHLLRSPPLYRLRTVVTRILKIFLSIFRKHRKVPFPCGDAM